MTNLLRDHLLRYFGILTSRKNKEFKICQICGGKHLDIHCPECGPIWTHPRVDDERFEQ